MSSTVGAADLEGREIRIGEESGEESASEFVGWWGEASSV